jgi:hypothetical protein
METADENYAIVINVVDSFNEAHLALYELEALGIFPTVRSILMTAYMAPLCKAVQAAA